MFRLLFKESVPSLPQPPLENTQPLENNVSGEDYQTNHSSLMEIMNDFNSTDSMIFTSGKTRRSVINISMVSCDRFTIDWSDNPTNT